MRVSELGTVAFLGGTGAFGTSLGWRFAKAGVPVILGSRSQERADAAADAVNAKSGGRVTGMLNAEAAAAADITVIAVPWSAHAEVLKPLHDALRGKLVVDAVNPIGFDHRGAYPLHGWEGSAAQQAAALLSESTVTSAFHTVAADLLAQDGPLDSDVLVMGDDESAVATVCALAELVDGVRGVPAGQLRNSQAVEALVANIIAVNRAHGIHAGLRLTGLPEN
ncbi:NADPH-dependent F420 reductase [Nocardioides sp. Kera G14]|uniref:NADPH-dependent F420 reductase n=1 Tax=Nocardioides sp. Kera G14 TaxID=2884264 RepID=UPI001D11F7C7|nr:NADPH-dependent F420 reductase [Nocardioides sp. Kera G14]UDY24171.1 NADPH-dependent F420 reductase [Nocardioides sp. Kera G14]